jgi:hypothetical protein
MKIQIISVCEASEVPNLKHRHITAKSFKVQNCNIICYYTVDLTKIYWDLYFICGLVVAHAWYKTKIKIKTKPLIIKLQLQLVYTMDIFNRTQEKVEYSFVTKITNFQQ